MDFQKEQLSGSISRLSRIEHMTQGHFLRAKRITKVTKWLDGN